MELVVVLLFFSICAAICVSLFGSAQQMARDSHNLSSAVLVARSAASCYKSTEGNMAETVSLLEGSMEDDVAVCYYDADWEITKEQEKKMFVLQVTPTNKIGEAEIVVADYVDEQILFTLAVKSGRGGGQHGA